MNMRPKENAYINSSYITGIGVSIFGFAPVLAIVTGFENLYVYFLCIFIIVFGGIASFFNTIQRKYLTKHSSVSALWTFFILIFLHSLTFDTDEQWQSLFSVSICVCCIYVVNYLNKELFVKGIIMGTVATGIISAIHMISDEGYIYTKIGGFISGYDLHYLTLAQPVAGAVGAAVVYTKISRGKIRLIWLSVFAVLVFGLSYSIARMAIFSALLVTGLGLTFSNQLIGWRRFSNVILSSFIFIPILSFGFVYISETNEGLGRRLERLFDPIAELQEGGRAWVWSQSFEMFSERPLWGWNVQGLQTHVGTHAHNAVLEAAGDLGIAGGVAIAAIFLLFLTSFLRAMRYSRSPDVLAIHLIGFVIALEALKSNTIYLSRITLLLLVLIPVITPSYKRIELIKKQYKVY